MDRKRKKTFFFLINDLVQYSHDGRRGKEGQREAMTSRGSGRPEAKI